MFDFLYNVCIAPLVMIIEACYVALNEILESEGWAVVGISVIVTILTLPLYDVAERWQQLERDTQARLKGGVDRIKAVFKGDEQYMILSTYYRQNHYHPMMALRSSFGLLIQVPFFIAAYNFLSNLEVLKGISFLFIRNLGEPDSVITLSNGFSINILPILMTLINCVAGAIYTKGFALREKLQIYGMALIFLVLLYNSPSALVLYWTMNNVLSLVKNIGYKLKKYIKFNVPKSLFPSTHYFRLPCLDEQPRFRFSIFLISALSLAILSGIVIPSFLIESEVNLYCYIDEYLSPAPFLVTTFAKALGIFVLWPTCFYFLFSAGVKKFLSVVFPLMALGALVNSFVFSGDYGPLNPDCTFMGTPEFIPPASQILLNGAVLLGIAMLFLIVLKHRCLIARTLCVIALLSLVLFSGINTTKIFSAYNNMTPPTKKDIEPVIHLSSSEKNVIVLMMDAFVSGLIPLILEEKPELQEQLSGFTWYPNTVTFGRVTMLGVPSIYGGYDYTPYEANLSVDKTVQKKHNEAVLSMPIVFNEAGFKTTITDVPYENYLEYPVDPVYEPYPFINRMITHGTYTKQWEADSGFKNSMLRSVNINRNMIWFSVFKIVPPVLRKVVRYNDYWTSSWFSVDSAEFLDNYSVLHFLPDLTAVQEVSPTFHFIDNEASHSVSSFIDKTTFEPSSALLHQEISEVDARFLTQTSILLRLGEWFDYLKQVGVYDNTRIIIVSDHGANAVPDDFPKVPYRSIATLMVKDFGSTGLFKSDLTFMTNADTPALATVGIIENARNPFTDNAFAVSDKRSYLKIADPAAESTRIRHNTQWKINPEDYWTVDGDDVYDESAWRKYFKEPTE